jgi:hypothetical protein
VTDGADASRRAAILSQPDGHLDQISTRAGPLVGVTEAFLFLT